MDGEEKFELGSHPSLVDLRGHFLLICFDLKPSMIETLRKNVYPPFCEYLSDLKTSEANRSKLMETLTSDTAEEDFSGIPFLTAATTWAEEHNLRAPWVVESTTSLLHLWTLDENYEGVAFKIFGPHVQLFKKEEIRFRFDPPAWIPGFESKADAKRRFDTAYRLRRDQYLERLGEKANELGIKDPTPNRPRESTLEIRMKWLAQYLVLEWSLDQILKEYKADTGIEYDKSNLSTTMQNLARDLDLLFPKRDPGRRPKADAQNR